MQLWEPGRSAALGVGLQTSMQYGVSAQMTSVCLTPPQLARLYLSHLLPLIRPPSPRAPARACLVAAGVTLAPDHTTRTSEYSEVPCIMT